MGRKGLSLHKESWTRLGNVLKERFGIDLAQKQMKNAHDNLKAKYVGWCYLREKTGNIYNPQTNMFTLTNEEWEDFKKVCSIALTYIFTLKKILLTYNFFYFGLRGIRKLEV